MRPHAPAKLIRRREMKLKYSTKNREEKRGHKKWVTKRKKRNPTAKTAVIRESNKKTMNHNGNTCRCGARWKTTANSEARKRCISPSSMQPSRFESKTEKATVVEKERMKVRWWLWFVFRGRGEDREGR
jgi:hypothetical protein